VTCLQVAERLDDPVVDFAGRHDCSGRTESRQSAALRSVGCKTPSLWRCRMMQCRFQPGGIRHDGSSWRDGWNCPRAYSQ
jgi:hypothetical protein